jgi:hypothetical protein
LVVLVLSEIRDGERCLRLIQNAIATFDLNLSGFVILTEAATGYYMLTPLIAARGGADRVYALTRNSRYGDARLVCDQTMALAKRWGVAHEIEILFSREDKRVGAADIVTNLGFVRPLDACFLRRLKKTAVIPLMFEPWEFRSEDLDLAECRRLGIPILGTNEHHPDLRIFEYLGLVALKLLFDLHIEIFRTPVVVMGSGEFADHVSVALRAAGAQVTLLSTAKGRSLKTTRCRQALQNADTIVVVEHHHRDMLIGKEGQISADELYALNPNVTVAHICGNVDRAALTAVGVRSYPETFAPPGHMSLATEYLGPRPLIDLHTAGLRIGEALARARAQGLSALEAEVLVQGKTPLALPLSAYPTVEALDL